MLNHNRQQLSNRGAASNVQHPTLGAVSIPSTDRDPIQYKVTVLCGNSYAKDQPDLFGRFTAMPPRGVVAKLVARWISGQVQCPAVPLSRSDLAGQIVYIHRTPPVEVHRAPTRCYLFTVSNSGLLSVQRPRPASHAHLTP